MIIIPFTSLLCCIDCGGIFVIPSSLQEIQLKSPNFPNHYQNSSSCTWTIYAPEDTFVYAQFYFIKLERKYDWLKVCNGKLCSANSQLAKLSGKILCRIRTYYLLHHTHLVFYVQAITEKPHVVIVPRPTPLHYSFTLMKQPPPLASKLKLWQEKHNYHH